MRGDGASRRALRSALSTYALLVTALVIECIIFQWLAQVYDQPAFISVPSLVNVLNRSVVYGILAVGMTYVILTGGIDLSVGSVVAFSGVTCALVVKTGCDSGHGPVWAWLLLGAMAALMAGFACGTLAGVAVTWFGVPPFIATLALMSSLRGLGYILADGQPISPMPDGYTVLGRYRIGDVVPVAVVVMLAVFLAAGIVLKYTRFGRHVRAIGGNMESARLSGIPTSKVRWGVYSMCAVLAALGGLVASSKLGSGDPKAGLGYELGVIAAVVVGGTSLSGGRGTIGGTLLGLLIIAVLETGLNWIKVATFGQQVTLGIVIFAAVLLDQFKGRARA